MTTKRKQLTLFLPKAQAKTIEKVRQEFNPIQYKLIHSHITLCREDEIEPLDAVLKNLENLPWEPLIVNFDHVRRFSGGKGVIIPGSKNNEGFHLLRKKVLKGIIETPRNHQPHITLMHPRNSSCTDEIFLKILNQHFPSHISFHKISLIEQEIGKKWKVLEEFEIA